MRSSGTRPANAVRCDGTCALGYDGITMNKETNTKYPTAPRPWILAECTLETVRQSEYQMAILPLGATEPHNLHLPYATDIFEAEWIASEIAEAAWEQGARPVVLPVIPYLSLIHI